MQTSPRVVESVLDDCERFGFHGFIRHFWPVIDPNPYSDNWHIGAIAEVCTAVSKRQMGNVIINVPPGTSKSSVVSVLWPAWHWGPYEDPRHMWMFASQDVRLTLRDAVRHLDAVRSDLYRACWPHFDLGGTVKAAGCFTNRHGGRRFSTTPRGGAVGWHAHTQVFDDPLKPIKANSQEELDFIYQWWTGTMSTRVAGPHDQFRRVGIMQRLCEGDLAGRLLADGYEHLMLPMRWVPQCHWDRGCSLGKLDARDPEYVHGAVPDVVQGVPGTTLDVVRFPESVLAKKEREFSDATDASAQWQQNPTPRSGGLLEQSWLRHEWDPRDPPLFRRIIQSWDLGFKGRTAEERTRVRSRVAGDLWAEVDGVYYLLDCVDPTHCSYPQAKDLFLRAQTREIRLPKQRIFWGQALPKLIEDKASGTDLIAELRDGILVTPEQVDTLTRASGVALIKRNGATWAKITGLPVKMPSPTEAKETRVKLHSDKFRCGLVRFPPKSLLPWVEERRHELYAFPHGAYDDGVDTMTQALDYLATRHRGWAEAMG